MPKIEAGATSGSFLINGQPYRSSNFDKFTNTANNLASPNAKIHIAPANGNLQNAIAVGTIDNSGDQWTGDADQTFATQGDFFTYLEGFFF